MLATAALLGAAGLMGTWIAPSSDDSSTVLAPAPAPAAKAKSHKKARTHAKAKAKARPKLTAKQLAARTAAVTVLRNQGYLPTRESDFNPRHELRVLIGYRNGDPLSPRRAFFFVGDRLIGNDSSSGSSTLTVAKSGNRWATLAYGVYAPGGKDPVSTTKIRFDWNGTSLTPAGTIPPSRLASG